MSDTQPAEPSSASPLEERLGYRFAAPALLVEALTHPSWANMQGQRRVTTGDNQRLEFLGDAVVDLLVSERLFVADPSAREGVLTERRAAMVNEQRLARAALELDLGKHLLLAPGEERAGFRERPGVLADAFEAITAAIFRDGGLEAARTFIARALPELERGRPARLKPAKARLQELTQERWKLTPSYSVLASVAGGAVEVEVRVGERLRDKGTGGSRREAENAAAVAALSQLAELGRSDRSQPAMTEAPE